MGYVAIDESHLDDIARAIRKLKCGSENANESYYPREMAIAIRLATPDPEYKLWAHLNMYNDGVDSHLTPFVYGIQGSPNTKIITRFYDCPNLTEVDLSQCKSVSLGINCFASNPNLKKITFPRGSEECVGLGNRVFADCPLITKLVIPQGASYTWPFEDSSITKIYLKGAPATGKFECSNYDDGYTVSPFASCEKLTDLYVPWSKGEVKGLWWKVIDGVPTEVEIDILEQDAILRRRGVKIHYNYVFDGTEG